MDRAVKERGGEDGLQALYRRPGFLIRRAHQITVSLFMEEAMELGATTTQYGVLKILSCRSGLDQIGLAKLVGLDRSTTALVVTKLENDGCLERRIDPTDRRRRELVLTAEGQSLLRRLEGPARRAQQKALSALTDAESKEFLRLLEKFVNAFNEVTRAPIMTDERGPENAPPRAAKAGAAQRRRTTRRD